MNEIKNLTLLELRSFYGINKYRYTKNRKDKKRFAVMAIAVATVIFMLCSYTVSLVLGLCYLNMASLVPAYLSFITSLVILLFGIFKAGEMIFGKKGYDLLASMPIRPSSIVISRFLAMYAEDLLITILIMLPGCAAYVALTQPALCFYLTLPLAVLIIPLIPLVISTALGTLIAAITSRIKYKSAVGAALAVIFTVAVISLTPFGESFSEGPGDGAFAELADTVFEIIGKVYYPAIMLSDGMLGENYLTFTAVVLTSLALAAVAVFITARIFQRVMRALSTVKSKHDYQLTSLSGRSLLSALWVRELRRYFSSMIYLTNTVIGPVLAIVASASILIAGKDTVVSGLPQSLPINRLLPCLISSVVCMMTTTSCSISMEGKHIDLIKALPIPQKALYDAKILMNLTTLLPSYLVSEILLTVALKPTALEFIWQLLIPLAMIFFSVTFGITVDLKFHRFDWEREEQTVKQSASAAIGGFSGMLISLAVAGVILITPPAFADISSAAVCVLLAVITALLYIRNNRTDTVSL